ncbi:MULTISPECIES: DUF1465 family protein [unclassified Sphingosinithalassobacter]|uniref:DUF1465 family protein n=1 Tax=unclassified Sphingosinithalassobacter TaxID=2676235 RepID=UPI00165D490F|nr:DUF1465 family protein [Sphingosinithalassobacter sp. CS137]
MHEPGASRIHRKLIDSLYVESMLLADEARAYFDATGRDTRLELDPLTRVTFSCESLKVTTRLMHVIAWLLTHRAVDAGEISESAALLPSRRLGNAPETEDATLQAMPGQAATIIVASIDLYRRVARLDNALDEPAASHSPARSLVERLTHAF